MRTTLTISVLGLVPPIVVDRMTTLQHLPIELKIDMLLRWGMYGTAMLASLTAIISFIIRWRNKKI